MNTLVYPIEEAKYNTPVSSERVPRNQYDAYAFSSLAAYHMPRAVEITLTPDDSCEFSFHYPSDEPAERKWRQLASQPGCAVKLGKHSHKILIIRFTHAMDRLREGSLGFDPHDAAVWVDHLPAHAQFAGERNAQVIATFLRAMPQEVRQELRAAASGATKR